MALEGVVRRRRASPEMAAAWEDVANYARTDQPFWLCTEHILIAPPATGLGLLGV